jgi:hypothetical protein
LAFERPSLAVRNPNVVACVAHRSVTVLTVRHRREVYR